MIELYPYFTNDGSVGLYSREDDDIYHSTYGAISESWKKFVIPARFEEYINNNSSVKVLDICYGIGYNTKTALEVFVRNFYKNKKNILKKQKKINTITKSIAQIYSDNISRSEILDSFKNNKKYCEDISTCIAQSDTDNISHKNKITENIFCTKLMIDSVDTDKNLINLSPFITRGKADNRFMKKYIYNKYFKNKDAPDKFLQIKKISKTKMVPLPNNFKLSQETMMILCEKMFENNSNKECSFFDDEILQFILTENKFKPFLSKTMINFAKFYKYQRYKYKEKGNNLAFLHNIYYRYISNSYKKTKFLLDNSQIDLNFHSIDARAFVKEAKSNYNFIFLDAFTPAKCPALWSLEFFNVLYSLLEEDGMILTYSNSAAIRNTFLKNGFHVGKVFDSELNKFTGTIATKNPDLIDYPLSEDDIKLINSRAGICFRDETLSLTNPEIISAREIEVNNSDLISSTKVMKEINNAKQI